jgi:hypothetical protein
MMDVGVENIKERIWLSWQEYSVLEEKMEHNESGWSYNGTNPINPKIKQTIMKEKTCR